MDLKSLVPETLSDNDTKYRLPGYLILLVGIIGEFILFVTKKSIIVEVGDPSNIHFKIPAFFGICALTYILLNATPLLLKLLQKKVDKA